jgi:hypothetical protein
MSDAYIQEVQIGIDAANEKVDLMNSMEKLRKNRDFKKIVSEGYMEQEAIRLVHLMSDPSPAIQSPDVQESLLSMIKAIGHLENYFKVIYQFGHAAKESILESERSIEETLAEEEEGI